MKRVSLLTLSTVLLALAGCGSSSSSSSTTTASSTPATSAPAATSPSSSASGVHVVMKNLAFSPDAVSAKVGQTITWTNDDSPPHNVTYVSGPKFTSSSTLNPGATFSLKLTKAGVIHYYCSIHPFMKATIVVTP